MTKKISDLAKQAEALAKQTIRTERGLTLWPLAVVLWICIVMLAMAMTDACCSSLWQYETNTSYTEGNNNAPQQREAARN